MFIFEKERDRVSAGDGKRERETQNPQQAPGSELSAQSPSRGSNPWTARSWPEPKSDARLNHPGSPSGSIFKEGEQEGWPQPPKIMPREEWREAKQPSPSSRNQIQLAPWWTRFCSCSRSVHAHVLLTVLLLSSQEGVGGSRGKKNRRHLLISTAEPRRAEPGSVLA